MRVRLPRERQTPDASCRTTAETARSSCGGKINREEIAAIVDKFLAGRAPAAAEAPRPAASQSAEVEAGSMYSGPPPSGRTSAPAHAPAAADKPAAMGVRQLTL